MYINIYNVQGPAEVTPLSGVGGYVNASHEMDSKGNMSPKMPCGELECDIVML